jgi:arabinose-5-phosphate isomerase
MSNNLLVLDVMHTGNDLPLVLEDDLFRSALDILNNKRWGAVCVVNAQGMLRGIITDGDVRRIILRTQDPLPKLFVESVSRLMVPNPLTASPSTPLKQGLREMSRKKIWVLPVVDENGKCVGLLHLQRVLASLLEGEAD